MKLLVLCGLLAVLLVCAEGSLPQCEDYQVNNYCPYPPPHECQSNKDCRYGQYCCRGPCYNECRPSPTNGYAAGRR